MSAFTSEAQQVKRSLSSWFLFLFLAYDSVCIARGLAGAVCVAVWSAVGERLSYFVSSAFLSLLHFLFLNALCSFRRLRLNPSGRPP